MYHIDTLVAAWWEVKRAPYIFYVKEICEFLRPRMARVNRSEPGRIEALRFSWLSSNLASPPPATVWQTQHKQHDRQQ
jgi:hypothetical protein